MVCAEDCISVAADATTPTTSWTRSAISICAVTTCQATIGPRYLPDLSMIAETLRSSLSGPTEILALCGRFDGSARIFRWWLGSLWKMSIFWPTRVSALIGRCSSIERSVSMLVLLA